MTERFDIDLRPSLYRVAITSLVIALAANVLLWRVIRGDDTFATVIAFASGIAALLIALTAIVPQLIRWREEALLLAFAVWSANTLEFWLEDGPIWETKARQGGFYLANAVLALGTYLATRIEREDTDR